MIYKNEIKNALKEYNYPTNDKKLNKSLETTAKKLKLHPLQINEFIREMSIIKNIEAVNILTNKFPLKTIKINNLGYIVFPDYF